MFERIEMLKIIFWENKIIFSDLYLTNPVASGTSVSINANTPNSGGVALSGFTGLTVGRVYGFASYLSPLFALSEL